MTVSRNLLICILICLFWFVSTTAQETESTDSDPSQEIEVEQALPDDSPVARVDGQEITAAALNRALISFRQRLTRIGETIEEEDLPDLQTQVLDALIERQLLYDKSVAEEIEIEDEKVAEKLTQIKSQFASGKDYRQFLERTGLSESDIRFELRQDLAIAELLSQEALKKTSVSTDDARDYYDQNPDLFTHPVRVRASHILIALPEEPSESQKKQALRKIKRIKDDLDDGDDFAEVAKARSDGPSSKRGGDLGYFGPGQMVEAFEEAAFALEKDEISDIVTTRFGYHLILVTEKEEPKTEPFSQVKEQITKLLSARQTESQVGAYVAKLKEKAKIEYLIE